MTEHTTGERPAPPEALDHDPTVRTVMTHRLVAVDPAVPLATALQLMIAGGVRHLPVIDGTHCIGIVTETDLLRGLVACHGPLGSTTLPLEAVTTPVRTVDPGTSLHAAAALMDAAKVDVLLVGDDESGPIGILTATDLIHALAAIATR
ncbi:CBS domain-containing protein [Pseudonocardia sp. RS11V-5]|uniref:CBS domain-containing protein n=1 Tax=Pseudonocardia terrae TaxID=2905831 RepID=UPI001E4B19BB|nr:CBS domain-containing protein [Pseudonocardia terrae]MCE3553152.1 CBS domain-containing protein [Pseudonocardia terrae]